MPIIPVGPVARNRDLPLKIGGALAAKIFLPVLRTSTVIDGLKVLAMLCGVGLLVSLLLATYGVDLSPGFF
jgi:hypothetical protein